MSNIVELEYRATGNQLVSESNKVANAVDNVGKQTGKTSGFMKDSFKVAAGTMIASFSQKALSGVSGFLKGMVTEARESVKVSNSTAQGIKTIGASSWTSAKQIGDLSTAISNKIGVDDELIQTSANLLLTFKNVRNEAGKNNDIFNRGVQASQDLAAKGFGSAESSAKMLGKALNDPVKGISALSRAGVTFTEGQKKQIAAMVKSGDLLGAQKIIMKELEAQVGGTAAATATAGDKMAVTWGNFQEKLGTAILPTLDMLLTKLMGVLDWATNHQGIVIAIAAVTAGIWLLNAALAANPIILVISLVAALVAALVILWTTNEGFRNAIINAWNAVWGVIKAVVTAIVAAWNWMWARGTDVVTAIVNTFWRVINFFRSIPGWVRNALATLGAIIAWPFQQAYGIIMGIINGMVGAVKGLISNIEYALGLQDRALSRGSGMSRAVGNVKKHHSGGVVSGMPGTPQLRMLMAGERVTPAGQGGSGGDGPIQFVGDMDSAFATIFMNMIRDRKILIPGVNV